MAHEFESYGVNQRITQAQKNKNNKQWYKDQADQLDHHSFGGTYSLGFGGISRYREKKINYDLFNNEIDIRDFNYVAKPFGEEMGDLPANFANRDIVSGKIKVLLGMEMNMPFSWKVVAVNEEATTRKEQHEAQLIRDFVVGEIMKPIRTQVQQELMQQQNNGQPLNAQQQQQLQAEIEKQVQARTPDEVFKYMKREHQDPAEMLNQQILQYLIYKEKIPDKFNKGWKHACLGGEDIYWIGIINGEPVLKVVNPLFFDSDSSPDIDDISEGEWAAYEMRLSPSEIVSMFSSEITPEQIDRIYDRSHSSPSKIDDLDWSFNPIRENEGFTHRVMHFEWKSLRKIGFLTYLDENEEEQMEIVDENYKFNKLAGDIKLEWDWIPEAHEAYKVMDDMYFFCRPVPGQHKNLDNLYHCPLSYYGSRTDNLNSKTTSPMDRIRGYQYLYNIIIYRIELLMASDKGKILAANIGAIPSTNGLDLKQFMYFLEANKIAWYNTNEEGNKLQNTDAASIFNVLDMSLVSDIAKYIEIANLIERRCGQAIGVTPQMEAQISSNEAVTNTKQNLVQASHIIRPYFQLHNTTKANVLNGILEKAKVAYATGRPRKLTYIMDDMSSHMLSLNEESMAMLGNSTMGLFVADASKAHDAREAVNTLAQAAMQNQQADLSDILKVIRAESITEAEELLEAARQRKIYEENEIQMQQLQTQQQINDAQQAHEKEKWQHEKDLAILKEEERRKTVIQAETIRALGYGTAQDSDGDGELDLMEVYKLGQKAEIDNKRIILDAKKLQHTIDTDKKKLQQADEKLKIDRKKANKPTASSK